MESLQKQASRLAFALKHQCPFPFHPITLECWIHIPYITVNDRRVAQQILNNNRLTIRQLDTIIRYSKVYLQNKKFDDKNFIDISLIV